MEGESEPYSLEAESIKGHKIKMNVICHEDKNCKEIIIESPRFSFRRWLLSTVLINSVGFFFKLHLQDVKLMLFLIVLFLIILLIKIYFKVQQESLLVIASVGVQSTKKFVSGRTRSMFYNASEIHDIAINEGISMHQVIYYICLLLQNCSEKNGITGMVPLFESSWPPLKCLRRIRREVRPLLIERPRPHETRGTRPFTLAGKDDLLENNSNEHKIL